MLPSCGRTWEETVADKIVLKSKSFTAGQFAAMLPRSKARPIVVQGTGEVLREQYTQEWFPPDTRGALHTRILTKEKVRAKGELTPQEVDCWSLTVTASLHKTLHGQNVIGGPTDLHSAVDVLLYETQRKMGIPMPGMQEWFCEAVEVNEVFDLGSLDRVKGWIRSMQGSTYPRRQIDFLGDLGFLIKSEKDAIKFYAKGPEFDSKARDALRKTSSEAWTANVQARAWSLGKAEVLIKKPRLDLFIGAGRLDLLSSNGLRDYWDKQWGLFMRSNPVNPWVSKAPDVKAKLQEVYPDGWLAPFMVWNALAVNGEQGWKACVPASTWRYQRNLLKKAGVSWRGSGQDSTPDAPEGLESFVPCRASHLRLVEELPYDDRATREMGYIDSMAEAIG